MGEKVYDLGLLYAFLDHWGTHLKVLSFFSFFYWGSNYIGNFWPWGGWYRTHARTDLYNTNVRRSREDNCYTHFTFDLSQNIAFTHKPRQVGPLYFLTLRKVQLFGFRIDAIPWQLTILIEENETIGMEGKDTHGPNVVISMDDLTLKTDFSIHADNCPDS